MQTQIYHGKYEVEYSIVNISELEGALRIDAEYYDPVYLRREKIIEKKNSDYLENIAPNDYITFSPNCDYFNYIEISNVNLETGDYIIEKIHCDYAPSRAKKLVSKNDIIISTVRPNRNAVAIIYHKTKNLVASTGFCKLTAKKINPKYLFILFKTYIYRDFLVRKTTATMYPAVSEYDIINLKIPIPSDEFQEQIENLVLQSHHERENTEHFYNEAEEILLNELRLKDWKPITKKIVLNRIEYEEEKNISIMNLSDVLKVDRLDAEYWDPKYDELEDLFRNYKKLRPLKKFMFNFQKGIEIGSENYQEEGKFFIRVSNLSINGFIEKDKKYMSEELYSQLKDVYEPRVGDFLLTKDATPGITYVVKEPVEGIIASGILKLNINENEINKEYLALCINSIIGKLQIEQSGGGSVITHWRPEQIKELQIPILPHRIQQKIASLIQQSYKARRKAKGLLEIAKKSVEIYIEKNEEEGLKYMVMNH